MPRSLTETEYHLLAEYAPVMIWRAGLDGQCDYFNDTWLTFTGRTMEQEAGDGWTEGVHPDDFDRCMAYYLDHFHRRVPFEMEYRLRRNDGAFRWIFDRGVPFFGDDGAFSGFIGSCIDIDDRRQAQEAREKRDEKRIRLARQFEDWVLAIVSHDIRNPLGVIRLATQHLMHVADDPQAVRTAVARIVRGADRIDHIVADLLDFSREREGSGIAMTPNDDDMALLCRQVVEELQAVARDRPIVLECNADTCGCWDRHRILQALSNLATNAIQHGPPNTPVRITCSSEPGHVTVAVHNGGTIPPDLLPKIFDPFRAGKEKQKRGSGLGLGLFIARTIANAHGGDVEVDSSAETGTTFRLVLPRRSAAMTAPG